MNDLDTLQRDGFVVIPGAVSAGLVREINDGIDRFKQRNPKATSRNADEFGRLYRVVNLHLVVDAMCRLLTENPAIEISDGFFGEPTSLYTSLYYERGSEQPLHRDAPLFVTSPADRYMGVWTALDEVDDENGPLTVVPGSHALPPVDLQAIRREVFGDGPITPMSQEAWNAYQAAVSAQCDAAGLAPQTVLVHPGDVVVWHPLMFHGGAPHLVARTRRSVAMHVTPKGTAIGHMDAFFDPTKNLEKAPWGYYRHGDRFIARHHHVDFGHEYLVRTWRLRKG